MRRLKASEIPTIRRAVLHSQNYKCQLCEIELIGINAEKAVLDHDHTTGKIRGVLCRNCNGIEGKVFNLARRAKRTSTELLWLHNMVNYLLADQLDILHPAHRTDDEKRLRRNKLARERRHAKTRRDD